MAETKWTPGPWNVAGYLNGSCAVAAKTLIARVYSESFRDLGNETANAHLIAAAPDLYEALDRIADIVEVERREGRTEMDGETIAICRAALAKARGEK